MLIVELELFQELTFRKKKTLKPETSKLLHSISSYIVEVVVKMQKIFPTYFQKLNANILPQIKSNVD